MEKKAKMLSKEEISKLLKKNKREVIMSDPLIVEEARSWDYGKFTIRPELIGCVYTWMNEKYKSGDTLDDMVAAIGVCPDRISHSLKLLEDHGYLTIARTTKPYLYRIIK